MPVAIAAALQLYIAGIFRRAAYAPGKGMVPPRLVLLFHVADIAEYMRLRRGIRAALPLLAAGADKGIILQAEMLAIVQRQPAEGAPITGELLRKDIFKAIDKSQSSGIIGIYASAGLPEEFSRMLEEFFHLPCRRMPQDAVLQGGMLQAEAWTGIVRDVLMLDATDFDICVGHEVLMEDCTTIPAELSMETRYHTARPDRCIDIYLRKNNLLLDTPLAVKLSVEPLLDPGLREQTLRVRVNIDKYQHLDFNIENPHTGQRLDYPWECIRDQLI